MNTGQKNTHGRTIYRGPRGGEYVLGPAGRKIRSFTRAPAAAAPVVAATGPGYTGQKNILGRFIFRGPRGGEYVIGPTGQKIRTFTRAPAAAVVAAAPTAAATRAAARIAKRVSTMLKLSNNEYINKYGTLHNSQARIKAGLSYRIYNNAKVRAFNKDPKFLQKHHIPYVSEGRPNQELMTKLKLKNSTLKRMGRTYNGRNTGVSKKVYFNKKGELYYISLNGKKHKVAYFGTQSYFRMSNANVREFKRTIGRLTMNYPLRAIPPASPDVRRSSPELLENMMNQIYNGGRGSNINAHRYTAEERNVLARRLGASIARFKQQRNAKKAEAAEHRASLRTAITNAMKQRLRNQAAAANERVGYYNNAVRAYTRGLRAVKPLTGAVTPRARAMPATPNRYTPAPANVNVNAIYMPLNRPHLVVKTPGAGTIYLNPNTFTGFMKNAGRVNIAPANVRNWLRMARRDFPNEALFRHPLAAKNVTASHIRFSK
jgi:hypothetical protein